MPNISIIIPIYNAAPFLERCLRSLFEQSLNDIEYIFINDASTDESISIYNKIITEYPLRINQIKFINNATNLGQGECRKIGMAIATGDYIAACDADDWIEINMFEKMYQEGIDTNADVVVCDYYRELPNATVHEIVEDPKIPFKSLLSTSFFTLWCRIIKREIIQNNNLYPISGINMFEDVLVVARVYYYANRISIINEPLYHYNKQNPISTTTDIYSKLGMMRRCIDFLEQFFLEKGFAVNEFINKFKLSIKLQYLEHHDFISYRLCYPEISNYILKTKTLSIPNRICCYLASKGILYPIKIYLKLSKLK